MPRSPKPRIVIERAPMPSAQALLDARPDVEVRIIHDTSLAALQAEMPGADAVVLGITPFRRETIALANRLRVASRFGVGYDSVEVPALTERGIPLTVVGLANCETVADHAIGMMLAMMHRIPLYDRRMRAGGFADRQFDAQADLWRMTVLVVGFGRIGRRVARRLAAFEARVLVSDPYVDQAEITGAGFEAVSDLDAAMAAADLVTLHMPAMPDEAPFMDDTAFARMRPGAWFVNVSRGSLVDEGALTARLRDGRLAGAALDVFRREPIEDDNPLLALENVVLTPHTAAATRECWDRMSAAAVQNALDGIDGRIDPAMVINPEVLAG